MIISISVGVAVRVKQFEQKDNLFLKSGTEQLWSEENQICIFAVLQVISFQRLPPPKLLLGNQITFPNILAGIALKVIIPGRKLL